MVCDGDLGLISDQGGPPTVAQPAADAPGSPGQYSSVPLGHRWRWLILGRFLDQSGPQMVAQPAADAAGSPIRHRTEPPFTA